MLALRACLPLTVGARDFCADIIPMNAQLESASRPSLYDTIGGASAVRRIVDRFYDIMDSSPAASRIRAMHAEDLSPMRRRLFEFFSSWLGGPPLYFQRPGHHCIVRAHRRLSIGQAERDEWMFCMGRALEDCAVPGDLRTVLNARLVRMAEAFRNS